MMKEFTILIMGLLILVLIAGGYYLIKVKKYFNLVVLISAIGILLMILFGKYGEYKLMEVFEADKIKIVSLESDKLIEVHNDKLMKNVGSVVKEPMNKKIEGATKKYKLILIKKNKVIGEYDFEIIGNDNSFSKENVYIKSGKDHLIFDQEFYDNLEKILKMK